MKKITILMIMIITISSCSNMESMESDAEKLCDLTTQSREMKNKKIQLGRDIKYLNKSYKEIKEAQKQIDELEADLKKMDAEFDNIKGKYDEDEFQSYFLENCGSFKESVKNKIRKMKVFEQWGEDEIDSLINLL